MTTNARVETSFVRSAEEFDAVRAEWSELVGQSQEPAELQHDPDVIRLALRDPHRPPVPLFVTVRVGGRLRAVAPFYLQDTRVALRLSVAQLASARARALRLFGDRVLLHRDADAPQAIEAIFGALRRIRAEFDVIWVYTQRLDDPLWQFITAPTGTRPAFHAVVTSGRAEALHRLVFAATFDEYLAQIRAKPGFPGKTIRRFWRDRSDRCAVVRVSAPEDVPTLLEGVDRVYNRSWQARTYGARPRNSAAEVARLKGIAALGHLRSYLLTEDGQAIAFVLGYQYKGHYSYEETGYDSDKSAISPGSILTYAVIEDLFGSDTPRELDFGFGDGAYKRTFGNATSEVCTIYLTRSLKWRFLLGAQLVLNAADAMARRVIDRVGLARQVRRIAKRQTTGK